MGKWHRDDKKDQNSSSPLNYLYRSNIKVTNDDIKWLSLHEKWSLLLFVDLFTFTKENL